MAGLEVAKDAENAPASEETQEFTLSMDFKGGGTVDINVVFPAHKAILAVTALREIGTEEYVTRLLSAFRNDPSVSEKLKESGLSFDEPENDTPEED